MLIRFYRSFVCLFFCLVYSFCYADLASDTVYLTWQKDPTTTMTVQWVSATSDKDSRLLYRARNETTWQEAEGSWFKFPQTSQYLIHRIELTNLEPDTDYLFKLLHDDKTYLFRTMPSSLIRPLRFVVGGDMYHDGIHLMTEMCQQAAKVNPSFALVGGDIAYSVGSIHLPFQKINRWIEWLKAWHHSMITPEGRLIPIIAAIGNHDLAGHYDQTPAQAKIFSSLFPMPGESIYNVLDFSSYLSLLILDSGHANPIAGHQANWLKNSLDARQHMQHRFAIYHVPAYPSIRDFNNTHSKAIRQHWVPAFESGNLHAAFEHHDHAYKRSHLLLNNAIHPKGVLYLGDGAWGIEKVRKMKSVKQPFYLAKFASTRHVIVVTLQPTQQHFMCVDDQGRMIDEYSRSLLPTKEREPQEELQEVR